MKMQKAQQSPDDLVQLGKGRARDSPDTGEVCTVQYCKQVLARGTSGI